MDVVLYNFICLFIFAYFPESDTARVSPMWINQSLILNVDNSTLQQET